MNLTLSPGIQVGHLCVKERSLRRISTLVAFRPQTACKKKQKQE